MKERNIHVLQTQMAMAHIQEVKSEKAASDKQSIQKDNVSLFRFIVNSDMPESELSDDRLVKEAQIILAAGSATTARVLDIVTYYVLANDDIHSRLEGELKDVMASWPDRVPSWTELEKVEYLQAVIKEGLRWVLPLLLQNCKNMLICQCWC
jgi:cytochrome P450